ncbi:lipase family alpha/beta hydrolase [Andreprevotia chitinilytica]|uniref:lipase family alpha/beta hydrolase n=1 Tax=Andreprevotia chitinilytica TaxID=396808 RepID=UPI000AA66F5A|nr:triacylglycerol lipase [Andreprevotia chitinilytica]
MRMFTRFMLLLALIVPIWPAQATDTYTQTRYPIVLVHGIFGYNQLFGVDYFYRVPEELRRSGAQVYVAQVSATNSNEARGEELLVQVQQILALTGAKKVNLIGHSQGSPTSRYVASVRPDLVASVTSVGGVNAGSKLADVVRGVAPPGSVSESVASKVTDALVALINLGSGGSGLPQDNLAALDALTTVGTAAFNAKYPEGMPTATCGQGPAQVNGVRYFSWSGAQSFTNFFDPSDALFGITALAFNGEPNDGAISSCASHLGIVIRDNYRMNHLDEVNQFLGLTDPFEVNPVTMYRQHANRLQQAGL